MLLAMPRVSVKPSVEASVPGPFLQEVVVKQDGRVLGRARWHTAGGQAVQVLELYVEPDVRRQGVGGQLLAAVNEQARAWHVRHGLPYRRLWVVVKQKEQIHARSFFTSHAFHHVATMENLYRGDPGMVYERSVV
ncbi:MAG: GNAT family N-acetyltransferase [Phycisphaerae bacterium]